MKYYLIAGEASGDLHGSSLMKYIRKNDPEAEFRFFGGDLMAAQGGNIVCHYRRMAFMGFVDVIANIRTILGNLRLCKKDILEYSPDAVILIDYPGFNLKIAQFAHSRGLKVFYYISPKVWIWKKSRIPKLKKFISRMFVIFPFEVDFYKEHDIEAEYYGNPVIDAVEEFRKQNGDEFKVRLISEKPGDTRPLIALLCGSRIHEVKRCLPEMVKASKAFPGFRFIVAGVSSVNKDLYHEVLEGSGIELVMNTTYHLLEKAFAAVVVSGTATLETALFRVPQVVIYKTGALTYYVGRHFLKFRFFSLVNIIAGKEVVKELLQTNLAGRIENELMQVVENQEYRKRMLNEYDNIKNLLGGAGGSEKTGQRIVQLTGSRV